MSQQSQKLAMRIAEKARAEADRRRNVHRGIVVRVNPFKVELVHSDLVLERGEDMRVTKRVKEWLEDGEIDKHDTVLVMREAGDWTVFDVEERDG